MDTSFNESTPLPKEYWPDRVTEIPQPPSELWINGVLPDVDAVWLTVVGSRKATEYGKSCCRSLIGALAGFPVVIVSGLALGIDACAHEAALDAGLPCVAVPGSGLHHSVLAPVQNHKLAKRILESGGCLLSPFPPKYPPAPFTFPTRNRIMAGLSHAVLIVEATSNSGTLITARMAVDYNRDLGIVPGSIFAPGSHGPHQFLLVGATPIFNRESLLQFLGFALENDGNPILFENETQRNRLPNYTPHEQLLLTAITESPDRHQLASRTGLAQSTINETLTLLEIKGVITISGNTVERIR